ncbi:MAG TPA: Ku protein, partial [Acidobacteriota bacterium]|nr:Ku protein [Acidobacteriota bacterium]
RIKQQLYCPTCERTVDRGELVRGYEYAKGQYVIMEQSDFEKLEVAATRNIDVMAFVSLKEVDPIYFSHPYYLTPEGDSQKTFALFTQALEESQKAALVKFVMREKEYVGCIAPRGKALLLYDLYHKEEIKDVKDFRVDFKGTVRPKEVELAEQIIENLTEPFDIDLLKDTYQEKLENMLNQKAKGHEIKAVPARPPAKVVSLMDALKKSVMQTSKSKQPTAPAEVEKKRKKA